MLKDLRKEQATTNSSLANSSGIKEPNYCLFTQPLFTQPFHFPSVVQTSRPLWSISLQTAHNTRPKLLFRIPGRTMLLMPWCREAGVCCVVKRKQGVGYDGVILLKFWHGNYQWLISNQPPSSPAVENLICWEDGFQVDNEFLSLVEIVINI